MRKEGAAGLDARLAEAVPLSEFLFNEIGRDVNRSTLDGRARLAERAKPLLAQIPDGAFADLMRQRLSELTGVPQGLSGAREMTSGPHTTSARSNARSHAGKRSLVRGAIALLLQSPGIALDAPWPCLFSALRQPGIELLVELIALVRERPEITTGALLEHFAGRDEAAALQKLAVQILPGDPVVWQREWLDALAQLNQQTLRQRLGELQTLQAEPGLGEDDKQELLALMQMLARG